MRFTNAATAVVLSSAAFFGNAAADELEEVLGGDEASTSTTTSSTSIEKPTFTPYTSVKAPFFEQFTDDWKSRWTPSHAKKGNTGEEEWAYVGNWGHEEPYVFQGIIGDKGLVVKDKAAHHAISAKFKKPIDPKGKPLVVQYEVKLQEGLDCGGAYLKLLRERKELHTEEFSNTSPYVIMFGPDRCGGTNKVHFIFNHKNPKSGEYEEKHLNGAPMARIVKQSTLYTLIVKPDNYFEIRLDGTRVKNGTLLEDFEPPVQPAKEISDPDDKKPEDWVDDAMIPDAAASKPEDWDEDAPYEIVDEEATKPEDWLENEPAQIADPTAEKPEGWVDEEDGDWIAPMVANPKCQEASGCGKWEKPMKTNPAYKGKWVRPQVENPAYKGVWEPRKIANPHYFEDKTPADFEPMGAIGFELWTMNNGILFDNIYIGHSIEEAEAVSKATFDVKKAIEKQEDEATRPAPTDDDDDKPKAKSPLELDFLEDPVKYIKENLDLFVTLFKKDPVEAISFMPAFAGGVGAVVATVLAIFLGAISIVFSPAPAPAPKKAASKAKEASKDAKAKVEEKSSETEATTTGTDKPKATKRTSKKE
ncbi:calnexin-like protein [Drechslerella stenobrocha 248]|uniref:Calnexin-like protein n=1 Tax=Drechslerella stenobrocha 248 TaxID=1043628 RepID=W7I842_9PEZI|nr:calnexin-like protein [Drechslerella stenobrocha 248]